MKVGILTFQWASNQNFGASLQSYACRKLFEQQSNKEVVIINYEPSEIRLSKRKKLLFLTGKSFLEYNKKFLKLTKEIKSSEELKNLNNEITTFVVGSDQVWRGKWYLEDKEHYFLDFVDDNKKKIAYAASFGVDYWEGNSKLTEKIKLLIKKFDYISVREKSGVDICKNIFNVDSQIVLDPTLMLKSDDYKPILDDYQDKKHLKSKYIAYMILNDNKNLQNFGKKFSKNLKCQFKFIKGKSFKVLGENITFYNKVSQWLTYLKDAEFVITDSFHCTVFSLIFHKKFVVIANKGRGMARLESLLSIVGLENRFIKDIQSCDVKEIINKDLDYNEVDKKLEVHRKYSMDFLKKALED